MAPASRLGGPEQTWPRSQFPPTQVPAASAQFGSASLFLHYKSPVAIATEQLEPRRGAWRSRQPSRKIGVPKAGIGREGNSVPTPLPNREPRTAKGGEAERGDGNSRRRPCRRRGTPWGWRSCTRCWAGSPSSRGPSASTRRSSSTTSARGRHDSCSATHFLGTVSCKRGLTFRARTLIWGLRVGGWGLGVVGGGALLVHLCLITEPCELDSFGCLILWFVSCLCKLQTVGDNLYGLY